MPIGNYYCDYCDKEFRDTPGARKRHLQGGQHQRNRALWFNSFKQDPDQFSAGSSQSFARGVCIRFVNTGFCPYGDSCKYLHPAQNIPIQNVHGSAAPGLIDNRQPRVVSGGGVLQLRGASTNSTFGMSLGNLPPSLQPPPECGYAPLPFVDWG